MLLIIPAALSVDGICSRKATLGLDVPQPPPVISQPDEYFEKLGLEFVAGHEELSITELNDLFSRVSLLVAGRMMGMLLPMSSCYLLCCVVSMDRHCQSVATHIYNVLGRSAGKQCRLGTWECSFLTACQLAN